jgi:hypothetical protein
MLREFMIGLARAASRESVGGMMPFLRKGCINFFESIGARIFASANRNIFGLGPGLH